MRDARKSIRRSALLVLEKACTLRDGLTDGQTLSDPQQSIFVQWRKYTRDNLSFRKELAKTLHFQYWKKEAHDPNSYPDMLTYLEKCILAAYDVKRSNRDPAADMDVSEDASAGNGADVPDTGEPPDEFPAST